MAREQNPGYLYNKAKAAIKGLEGHWPSNIGEFLWGMKKCTVKDLLTPLREYVAKSDWERKTDAMHKTAVKERMKADRPFILFLVRLGQVLMNVVGDNENLRLFGYAPTQKRRQLTAEEKVEAARKMRATRAARHTMGKRQKAKIKGTPPPEK